MKSEFLSKIRTVHERDDLTTEIDMMTKSLYEEQGKAFESCLTSKVRSWVSEIVRKEAGGDLSEIHNYLNGLKETLGNLRVLNLTLAFEPSDISIDKLVSYVRKNVGEDVLLEFEYDQKILGGAQIKWNGEFRDFSLRRLFEEEYEAKKAEIMKIMYSK